jgi:hypothetical protein
MMVQAKRLVRVMNSIGVNLHVNYADEGSAYANMDTVVNALRFLGVRHVRDILDPNALDRLRQLTSSGYKLCANVKGGSPDMPFDPNTQISLASQAGVSLIEGFNEVNNFGCWCRGLSGSDAATVAMHDLCTAVARQWPVVDCTSWPPTCQSLSHCDFGNAHVYPDGGKQASSQIAWNFQANYGRTDFFPRVVTEFGYYTEPADTTAWGGVDRHTQAVLSLNAIFAAIGQSVTRLYFYELFDEYPDQAEVGNNFGLFTHGGSPKGAALAIQNLLQICADPGASASSFTPGSADVSVERLPATGNWQLFQGSGGAFYLVLWDEPVVWNQSTHQPVAAPTSSVTLRLGRSFGSVIVYDPLSAAAPVWSGSGADQVTWGITDHPIIVSFK